MVKKLVDVTPTLRNMTAEKYFHKWSSIISAHFIEAETTTVLLHWRSFQDSYYALAFLLFIPRLKSSLLLLASSSEQSTIHSFTCEIQNKKFVRLKIIGMRRWTILYYPGHSPAVFDTI